MPQTQSNTSNGNGSSIPTGTGNLQSARQYHFNVRIEGTPQEFTIQSTAFAMNFAQKELELLVEQSINAQTREHVVIQDIIDNPKRIITLEITNGNNVVDTIKFCDCVITQHVVGFNHGISAAVVHVLAITYDKIDLGTGKAVTAYANAMSVVGKP